MYKVVSDFMDLTDRHSYHAGDAFPFDGREIPEDRISALLTGQNKACRQLIAWEEETPKEVQKPRRRAGKPRKTEG